MLVKVKENFSEMTTKWLTTTTIFLGFTFQKWILSIFIVFYGNDDIVSLLHKVNRETFSEFSFFWFFFLQGQCSTTKAFCGDDSYPYLCGGFGSLWPYCWHHSLISSWPISSRLRDQAREFLEVVFIFKWLSAPKKLTLCFSDSISDLINDFVFGLPALYYISVSSCASMICI